MPGVRCVERGPRAVGDNERLVRFDRRKLHRIANVPQCSGKTRGRSLRAVFDPEDEQDVVTCAARPCIAATYRWTCGSEAATCPAFGSTITESRPKRRVSRDEPFAALHL